MANPLAYAEGTAPRSAPRFCRGINFHHLLNWPALENTQDGPIYIWPPFLDDKYKLRAQDLAIVRALEFDFVRLTVDPGLWLAEQARHGDELERRYLEGVESLLAQGLNVIFDLAPVDNHPEYTPSELISPEATQKFSAYAEFVARAARLLSRIPPGRVALELFNEPPLGGDGGEARWAAQQKRLHAKARDAAPELALVLTAAHWGDGAALSRLDVSPYRDSNVLYTFHYYEPYLFTHQGSKTGAVSYVSGLDWPVTKAQAQEAELNAEREIGSDKSLDQNAQTRLRDQVRHAFASPAGQAHEEATVARDFDVVQAWAQANAIAPERVLLGEFGCVLGSHGRPTGEARLRWLSSVRRAAEVRGFAWAYWAFKGYGGMELVDGTGALHADLVAPLGLARPRQ